MKIKTFIFIIIFILFATPMSTQPCLAENNETEEDVFDEAATTQSIETVAESSDNDNQNTEGENPTPGNQTGAADINVTEDDVFDEGTDAVPSENSQGRDTGDAGQSSANAANSQSENNPDREAGSESKTKTDNKGNHTDSASNEGSKNSSTTTSTKSADKPATDVSGKSQDAQSKVAGQGTKSLTGMSIGAIALGIIVVLVVIFAIVRKRSSKHSDK